MDLGVNESLSSETAIFGPNGTAILSPLVGYPSYLQFTIPVGLVALAAIVANATAIGFALFGQHGSLSIVVGHLNFADFIVAMCIFLLLPHVLTVGETHLYILRGVLSWWDNYTLQYGVLSLLLAALVQRAICLSLVSCRKLAFFSNPASGFIGFFKTLLVTVVMFMVPICLVAFLFNCRAIPRYVIELQHASEVDDLALNDDFTILGHDSTCPWPNYIYFVILFFSALTVVLTVIMKTRQFSANTSTSDASLNRTKRLKNYIALLVAVHLPFTLFACVLALFNTSSIHRVSLVTSVIIILPQLVISFIDAVWSVFVIHILCRKTS